MISTYRNIGNTKMRQDHFQDLSETEKKHYIIKYFCTDASFDYKNKSSGEIEYGRIIKMNLSMVDKSIHFEEGPELFTDAAENYLIFTNYAPADPNIYAAHIGYKSIFAFTLLEYIQKNQASINWSQPEKMEACLDYLQRIREDFFVFDDDGLRPNYRLLPEQLQDGFPDAELAQDAFLAEDVKGRKKKIGDYTKKYFEKQINTLSGEKRAYALTIDGEYLHKIELIAPFYIDVLYSHILDKQFSESKNRGFCHICAQENELSEKVALSQKFYGSKNPYYFDSVSASNNKYAFAMCKNCYQEVTVGTKHAVQSFNSKLLGLDLITLPEPKIVYHEDDFLIEPKSMKIIPRLLRVDRKSVMRENLNLIQNIQNHLEKFSFFFWHKPSATSQIFIVNQLINGISFAALIQKSDDLDALAEKANLTTLFGENYNLSFEALRFLLLPSRDSHPSLKVYEYQRINRDILALLASYLYDHSLPYVSLIKMFVDIHARKRNNVKDRSSYELDLSAHIMSLYIKHYQRFNLLSGIKTMEESTMTTQLENKHLIDYFENNSEVYQNNYPAQGLFILGTYISEIEKEQSKKGINKTAITKLNLKGIPLQKVKSVMGTIDDLRGIWVEYQNPITDAYYRECMQKILQSTLSPEEVVFHILAGRSYNTYINIMEAKKYKENKLQEANND